MAYRPPPELKSRVENIKKRFEIPDECSTQMTNEIRGKAVVQNAKQNYLSNNSNHTQRGKSPLVSANNISQACSSTEKCGNISESKAEMERQPSPSTNKGNIRRTPAFRCDKSVIGRTSSGSVEKQSVVNNRVKMFEEKKNGDQFKTSKVSDMENNTLLQSIEAGRNLEIKEEPGSFNINSGSSSESKLIVKNSSITKIDEQEAMRSNSKFIISTAANSSDFKHGGREIVNHNVHSTAVTTVKSSVDHVNMAKCCVSSDFHPKKSKNARQMPVANKLKTALTAPLPKGPPPKKPPRTFAHNSPIPKMKLDVMGKQDTIHYVKEESKSSVNDSTLGRKHLNPRTKVGTHDMLKKLETVLLNHPQGIGESNSNMETIKANTEGQRKMVKSENELAVNPCASGNVQNIPSDYSIKIRDKFPSNPEKFSSGCFDSLNCVSSAVCHVYEKPVQKMSEFFVDSPLCSRRKNGEITLGRKKNCLRRSSSEEHVYAEPYAFVDIDTILKADLANKGQRYTRKNSVPVLCQHSNEINKKSEVLHYMCTPISALDRIDALVNRDKELSQSPTAANCMPSESEEKIFSEVLNDHGDLEKSTTKKSFRNIASLVKVLQNTSVTTYDNVDRCKIQLFMNQAFGSPLQGMPLRPLDRKLSDTESLASTPDEALHPTSANEEEEEGRSNVKAEVPAHASGESGAGAGETAGDVQHEELTKLTEQRKVYVRRVSSRVFGTRQRLANSHAFPHLYHCIMLIGLNLDGEKRTKIPYIKSKYPPHATVPPLIEHLCFPDAADWPPPSIPENPEKSNDEQSYSLVITNETGDQMFGYCRRVMPEGTNICLPLAYCIVSAHRAKGFYFKLLLELESRHGQPEWLQTAFIKELYACEFPNPGQGLKLPNSRQGPETLDNIMGSVASQLRRPLDSRLEECDLTLLFSTLPVPLLLQVFGCLLLERKVLFVSSSLSKLSSCIEALHSTLYPFSWQYTFISVLPSSQIGVCEAPTPYIIGVIKDKTGKALSFTVEEGIVVDLEDSKVLQAVGDESTILPQRLKRCLKMALQLVASTTQDCEPSRNVLISEAFIRMFIEVCGHYKTHIVTQQDGKKVFERESFIKAVPSRAIQLFLEWFTETAMFSAFMEIHLGENTDPKGLFEQRILEHSEEMEKNTMLFLRNYKAINKKVKTFGDRLKDWTPFT